MISLHKEGILYDQKGMGRILPYRPLITSRFNTVKIKTKTHTQ